jgi:hypothetical protein
MTNGSKTYFTVEAVSAVGASPASAEISVTPEAVPSAPQGLEATAGQEQVDLSWTAPTSSGGSAISGYDVFEGTTAGGEPPTPVATGVTSTSTTINSLNAGTTYYFTVEAINSDGASFASSEASATPTILLSAPDAPSALVAMGGNTQVQLRWAGSASDGGSPAIYEVYAGTSSGGESTTPIARTSSSSLLVTSHLLEMSNGTTYFFTVDARNSVGPSQVSNEASATPAAVTSAPTNLAAIAGIQQASLTWSPPSTLGAGPVSSYEVFVGTSPGAESATPVATDLTQMRATIGSLAGGTKYYFTVEALNSAGASLASNEASARAVAPVAPPTALKVVGGPQQLAISWTAPSDPTCVPVSSSWPKCKVTGYTVLYRPQGSGPTFTSLTVNGSTERTIGNVINGTTYDVEVESINGFGSSRPTSIVDATPTILAPTQPPRSLVVSTTSSPGAGSELLVSWSSPNPGGCSSTLVSYPVCEVTGYTLSYQEPDALGKQLVTATMQLSASTTTKTIPVPFLPLGASGIWQSTVSVEADNSYGASAPTSKTVALELAPPRPVVQATGGPSSVTLSFSYGPNSTPQPFGQVSGVEVFEGTSTGGESTTQLSPSAYRFRTTDDPNGLVSYAVTITSLGSGTPYYFTLIAVGPGGSSTISREVTATPA